MNNICADAPIAFVRRFAYCNTFILTFYFGRPHVWHKTIIWPIVFGLTGRPQGQRNEHSSNEAWLSECFRFHIQYCIISCVIFSLNLSCRQVCITFNSLTGTRPCARCQWLHCLNVSLWHTCMVSALTVFNPWNVARFTSSDTGGLFY